MVFHKTKTEKLINYLSGLIKMLSKIFVKIEIYQLEMMKALFEVDFSIKKLGKKERFLKPISNT